jgi:hypothetical protein
VSNARTTLVCPPSAARVSAHAASSAVSSFCGSSASSRASISSAVEAAAEAEGHEGGGAWVRVRVRVGSAREASDQCVATVPETKELKTRYGA